MVDTQQLESIGVSIVDNLGDIILESKVIGEELVLKADRDSIVKTMIFLRKL